MKSRNLFQLLMIGVLITLFGMLTSCSNDDDCTPTSKKHAPTAPELKTPENKSKLSSGEEIKLMWEAITDQDKDPITYNVYLSGKDNSDLELLKSEVTSTFYTIDSILSEGTYQWKIEATDGKHKTSSEVFSFEVEKVYGLALSADNVYLKVESSKQVNITSGSGNYTVSIDNAEIATAALSGTTINIIGKSEGTATVTVTDTKTNQTKQVTITVKNLVISKDRIDLKVEGEETVSITSGSESYSVSSDKPEVAVAEVNGTEVRITGKSKGTAVITITDNLTEETKQITVKVNSLEVSKTEVSVEVGKTTTIEITSGSGDYSSLVRHIEVAGSELSGTTLTIKGKSEGNTVVTIFDNVLKEVKQVSITVIAAPSRATIQDVSYFITSFKNGDLSIQGELTDGLQIKIPYTNGEGSYSAVTLEQTTSAGQGGDVNTLSLSIPAGTYNGDGEVVATLNVKESNMHRVRQMSPDRRYDVAQFNVKLGGASFKLNIKGIGGVLDKLYNVKTNGEYEHRFVYIPVKGPDGRIWLNNNLGAEYARVGSSHFNPEQQAKSKEDYLAYGSLYQWGRESDGHELINWESSSKAIPKHNKGWKNEKELLSYSEPCPTGYHVPSTKEWLNFHRAVTGVDKYDPSGKMWKENLLKLPAAGYRSEDGSEFYFITEEGRYWSATDLSDYAYFLAFTDSYSATNNGLEIRSVGSSIRCVKD